MVDVKDLGSALTLIIGLGAIAFILLNLVGFGYLTAVIFGNTNYATLTTTQRNLVRMSVVISWIVIIGLFLVNLYSVSVSSSVAE